MRGDVVGVERRRRLDNEARLASVSAAGIDGAMVTQVAQRHELTRQQTYAWRHDLKRKGLWSPEAGALFLSVARLPGRPEHLGRFRQGMSADGLVGFIDAQIAAAKAEVAEADIAGGGKADAGETADVQKHEAHIDWIDIARARLVAAFSRVEGV